MDNPFYLAAGMVLAANAWAILRTLRSSAPRNLKLQWIAIVMLLPFVGMVAWIIFGPS
ncbi:MAG: PLD nuclease N-terminal domain-containing protein [Pseudomonadales bacterium]